MGASKDSYERKIQLAGGTTYTVSLPKEWASEQDLEAGVSVQVSPHTDGSLVVRTNGHQAPNPDPLTLPADAAETATLRRQVDAAYRTGRDAVALTSGDGFSTDQQAAVRSVAQDLLGVDVVEQSDDRLVCKSLLDGADVSVEQSLHQLQYVALSAHRDAITALQSGRGDRRSVDDRKAEADRLLALVARQFERALVDPVELDDLAVTRSTLFDYYTVARELNRVATHATTIATVASHLDDPLPDEARAHVDSAAEDVHDLVESATSALVDGVDADVACGLLADADTLSTALLDRTLADGGLGDGSPAELGPLSSALTATADCGGAIADVALRAAVRADDH